MKDQAAKHRQDAGQNMRLSQLSFFCILHNITEANQNLINQNL
ncbi:MAG: hypothetical protein OEV87_06185 [Phycisphaerae bacterium]|nr:hypothetical protein [Phycisphaerae bacterium]